eukprot:1268543-Alexandrium_andersonii.AAC.1
MSASLVGSEMCIRDSPFDVLDSPLSGFGIGWLAPEVIGGGAIVRFHAPSPATRRQRVVSAGGVWGSRACEE